METKRVELKFGGSSFHIDLEAGFAKELAPELEKLFQSHTNNDIKVLLQAFVQKSHELYELKKSVQKNIDKLENY